MITQSKVEKINIKLEKLEEEYKTANPDRQIEILDSALNYGIARYIALNEAITIFIA